MAKEDSRDAARYGTRNGEIKFGHVHNDQVLSAVMIRSGYTDLPEIIIESQTGYNAKLYPVLSATPITDEQAFFDIPDGVQLVSVVDCVGKILPKAEFDIVPR